MNNIVVDASAWLEYLNGTKEGELVKKILNNANNMLFTNNVTLSEVVSVAKRRGKDAEVAAKAVLNLSQIYEGNVLFFKEIGLLHAELRKKIPHFPLADAFVLLTAKKLNGKIVTGDSHFKGFKDVIMI